MLFHHLKIFLRLFTRQTIYSLINVMGLAFGIACCLVIAIFVRHELSYDRFFAGAENLYRVSLNAMDPAGVEAEGAAVFYPVAPLLLESFPEIRAITRMRQQPALIHHDETNYFENQFQLVDTNFFSLFNFTWVEGSADTAYSGPTDIVLTQSIAEKYFGSDSAVGQILVTAKGVTLRVTGVVADLPANTHLNGSAFISMGLRDILEPVESRNTSEWYNGIYYTYVQLQPGTDVQRFNRELESFSDANIPVSFNTSFRLTLDAISAIHLKPKIGDMKPAGSKLNLAVFTSIGLGILLIACFNFVNLTTARSAQRYKEVGLRLALGARRAQVISQFLGESILLVVLAFTIALALVELMLPSLQGFLHQTLDLPTRVNPISLVLLTAAAFTLGTLAGWYPAMVLANLKPVRALRNLGFRHIKGLALKNVLVVLQFSIAIVLIIAPAVIYSQMRYTRDLDLGYGKDRILVISNNTAGSIERVQLLKELLLRNAAISAATIANSTPERNRKSIFVGTEGEITTRQFSHRLVDADFFSVFDIRLLAGRFFPAGTQADRIRSSSNDTRAIKGSFILNEKGAREFGWTPEQAIGKLISNNGSWYSVTGVVADTVESAHAGTPPAIYAISEGLPANRYLSVKIAESDLLETLALIDRAWQEINPDEPIIRSFLDNNIEELYQVENKQMRLLFLFSAVAIGLSCMGLFGLATFSAESRTKEIGVRKVIGGSVWSIVLLLTNDFSKLVLLSNLLAWPVAYFAMERWLQNFAYRIDLTPLIFIGSGLTALCIAWMTVGGTAAKAAKAKPVLALRYE